jgi:hypothetical protein
MIEPVDRSSDRHLTGKGVAMAMQGPAAGFPFAAVEFDGLTVTPYVDSKTDRLAYSFRAKAMREPKGAAKTAAPAAGKAAA